MNFKEGNMDVEEKEESIGKTDAKKEEAMDYLIEILLSVNLQL